VRVLLFAALREAAGASRVESRAPDVASLLKELSDRYGPEFERIVGAGTVIVGGERAGPARTLGEDDEVALLPPVSGGSEETD
jgi:molybdopterin converting factor small subunit